MGNKIWRPVRGMLVMSVGLLAMPSYALSIEEAWQAAKQYDPSYEQAKIGVRAGEVQVSESRSALLPSMNATASTSWNDNHRNATSYGADITQTIWDSTLWSGLDQAQASYVASELELSKAQNALAQQLISAYLDVASAQGDLQLAQNKLAEGDKLLRISEKRYRAGKTKSIDIEDMRANQISEKAAILSAQSRLEEKRAELAALIDRLPEHVDEIQTDTLVEPAMLVSTKTEWLKLAKDNSPELLVAMQKLKVSEVARKVAQGGYYPKLTGNLGYQDGDRRSEGEFSAGLSLTVPIDLNGATRAKVDQASLTVLSAKQDVRKVEIDIQKRIQQQFEQVRLNWQQVLMAKELVDYRARVLSSKETLYDAGMAQASDVIDAHNDLFTARNSLQQNLYGYWRQRIGLLQAAGKLDDNTISMISGALRS